MRQFRERPIEGAVCVALLLLVGYVGVCHANTVLAENASKRAATESLTIEVLDRHVWGSMPSGLDVTINDYTSRGYDSAATTRFRATFHNQGFQTQLVHVIHNKGTAAEIVFRRNGRDGEIVAEAFVKASNGWLYVFWRTPSEDAEAYQIQREDGHTSVPKLIDDMRATLRRYDDRRDR